MATPKSKYRTRKEKAWAACMVLALNEAQVQGIITWDTKHNRFIPSQRSCAIMVPLPDGSVFECLFTETSDIELYLLTQRHTPTKRGLKKDLEALGWLVNEPKDSLTLTFSMTSWSGPSDITKQLAELKPQPVNYLM